MIKNCDFRIIKWFVTGSFVICMIATATQILNSSQVLACVDKAETPKSQTAKRFPSIAFGELASPVGKLTFVQRTTLPIVPSEVQVYKVQPLASKKEAFLKIFKALPIESSSDTNAKLQKLERAPESSMENEKSISASIGGWTVQIWNGGQFTIYNNELSDHLYDLNNTSTAPAPEEARKTADDFLAIIGSLPMDIQFSKVSPGDTITFGLGDKPNDTIVKILVVSYSAILNGIPVHGSVSIRVGAGPSVVSMTSRLRSVVPDSSIALLSPQEAFGKLKAGGGRISDGPVWNATANVTSMKLVYWQGAPAQDLSYVMPIYLFEGEAVADGKKTVPWRAYVEAIRPEFLETEPSH